MAHSTVLVWPEGPVPPVVGRRIATLQDASKRRFIRLEVSGQEMVIPEEFVTRLDRIFPDMTGAEISSEVGTA